DGAPLEPEGPDRGAREPNAAPGLGGLLEDELEGDTDLDPIPHARPARRGRDRAPAGDEPTIELGAPGARVAATGLDVVPVALCTKCGAQIEPNNRFCTDCGEPVARA